MNSDSKSTSRTFPSRREIRMREQLAEVSTAAISTISQLPGERDASEPEHSVPQRPVVSRLKRALQVTGAASVAGLVLSFALPSLAETSVSASERVSGQKFYSAIGSEDSVAGALGDIPAVAVGPNVGSSFFSLPDAVVAYPLDQPAVLTDGFSYRSEPVEQFHAAQDFGIAEGTPVLAIADGVVSAGPFITEACGFALEIQHTIDGKPTKSRYCHMQTDSHTWQVGDVIKKGEVAGRVGNTGLSFGAHLHLVVEIEGVPVDPMPFLATYSRVVPKPAVAAKPAA
ncbi:M23 family metallopeptidase [Leucobacter sp. 1207-22]